MNIETNDFTIPADSQLNYGDVWKTRLVGKIKNAQPGDVLIVRSGLQKAFAAVEVAGSGKRIKIIKRG